MKNNGEIKSQKGHMRKQKALHTFSLRNIIIIIFLFFMFLILLFPSFLNRKKKCLKLFWIFLSRKIPRFNNMY